MATGKVEQTVCGIVMPISHADDEHTEAHWREVKDVISEAIRKADCLPQPVWEGGSHDIIQSKILKNIFENEIVVCDISTRNPNVMLEVGMRLTTKKPTLIIAEEGTILPFDTSIIQTEFYDSKLQFRAATDFIKILSEQITEKLEAVKAETYQPYMEAFKFETVEPSRVTVSSEERLTELVAKMDAIVSRADHSPLNSLDWQIARELTNRSPQSEKDKRRLREAHAQLAAFGALDPNILEMRNALGHYAERKAKVGDIVEHDTFGIGKVTSIQENKLTVMFESAGEKRVLSEFVTVLNE